VVEGWHPCYLNEKKATPSGWPLFAGPSITSANIMCSLLIFAGCTTPFEKCRQCEIHDSLRESRIATPLPLDPFRVNANKRITRIVPIISQPLTVVNQVDSTKYRSELGARPSHR
jgi:hypothetical protein